MYVRDNQRPHFHAALDVNPKEYGLKVFRITSEIARQVFPLLCLFRKKSAERIGPRRQLRLLLPQHQIDNPAPSDVCGFGPAVVEDVVIVAAGILEGVGQNRHRAEVS